MKLLSIIFCAILTQLLLIDLSAADCYVPISLPKNVSVELPKNWTALTRNQRITLESSVQAVGQKAGIFDASSDPGFAANYYEDNGKVAAMFNIRYYPDLDISQQDAIDAGPDDITILDKAVRESIETAGKGANYSVLEWRGTKQQKINGTTIFVSEYTRTPIQNNGEFCVRLARVFREGDSYTITVSYRLSDELLLRPICDKVIASIKN